MAGIILCDGLPEVTERTGLFIVEATSGGDRITFALTQSALSILAHRAVTAVASQTQRRQAKVIPLPTAKAPKKRRR